MTKIAICYWGMTRSTKFVYKSHECNLFNILKTNKLDYDIFMHTWETDKNIAWNIIYDSAIDYEEYKLLNPQYYEIEKQDDFLNSINFADYFNEELYNKYGDSINGEWRPYLIKNHLCALESQKRVYNMVLNTQNIYDYVMFIRPDVEFQNKFDYTIFDKSFDIIVPNYDFYEGYNDKFAIIPFKKADKYATRIDEIIDFRKNKGRIVSEKYVKFIINKYYSTVIFLNFVMEIVRPNGEYYGLSCKS